MIMCYQSSRRWKEEKKSDYVCKCWSRNVVMLWKKTKGSWKKTSSILQKLPREEMVDRSKVLTLRILSQIRLGLYEEANAEIELLAKIGRKDVCPAILTALLLAAERQLEAYEKANRDLGKLLSELTVETEMVRPQLLDEVTLSAWKIADEMSMHQNPEVGTQLANAEFKSGNFQQSLKLYMELDKNKKRPGV